MSEKHLHIVCFDVPYPADYGGVIDVFYRIKSLYEQGIKIYLHCFEYGRGQQFELNKYCCEVNYYSRNTGWKGFSFSLPYIVQSRANNNLLNNLNKDDHPILLEGVHCSYFLFSKQLEKRKIFVRTHNVEFEYYKMLSQVQTSIVKRIYMLYESFLLKFYEKKITDKSTLLAITEKDIEVYKAEFNATNIKLLLPFLPYSSVNSKEGKGNYCLYHGNLSIAENENVCVWLCKNVFSKLNIQLVIAGKNPSNNLIDSIKKHNHISLINYPSDEAMRELINKAQLNILPSFNTTGIKLKIINALFNGRHVLVNYQAVEGTGLESLCHIAEKEDEFISLIIKLFGQPFSSKEIEERKQILENDFNNKMNAEKLIRWIY